MAFRKFSTKNADYVLGLMFHDFEANANSGLENGGRSTKNGLDITLFDNVDGLVVEDCGEGIAKVLYDFQRDARDYKNEDNPNMRIARASYIAADPRFEIIARNFKRVPLYSVDVDFQNTKEDEGRRYNSKMLRAFSMMRDEKHDELLSQRGELDGVSQWFNQLGFYLECEPITEGRNAINAEKIERGVVPIVTKYTGKKPTIGLIYGAYHLGIEQNLKSQRRRNKVIKKMRQFDGFDAERFNQFQEAKYNPERNSVEIKNFNGGFFKNA